MMFGHTYIVKGLTKIACHIYDHVFCHTMIVSICNMWFEDVDSQCCYGSI
jgi:hypothetical protein